MFGINGAEVLILLLVAVVVVGPERLPAYAEQLGGWVRQLRTLVRTTKDRVASEMGEDVVDLDWATLDPRRYDPRRIVREALLEDEPAPVTGRRYTTGAGRATAGAAAASAAAAARGPVRRTTAEPDDAAPPAVLFDEDAT
ncbi:twin-arginine translocase TatA/TatE family subunit [Cellulomonas carbonis]|uniref:Translocase n=1 Tax=Cellulomonas carbonis T26 TaxID=947969 RepID=A0A0A0BKY7_9CELL|nr:twin-arginine translocase TatA/TatE family subunit [Cellulomonas carbonis]KGM09183.1 translocase [Cellulomonas carbonis T26]GGC15099.1 translocase [Cellulomonas carbonis]